MVAVNGFSAPSTTALDPSRPPTGPEQAHLNALRVQHLEHELRGLMETVRGRNEEIGALANLVNLLRQLGPKGHQPTPVDVGTGKPVSPNAPRLLELPSDFKPVVDKASPAAPYANALSDFIDARQAQPADYAKAAGSNGVAISGFLDYLDKNREAFDARYAPGGFKPGFNGLSDLSDINDAFKNNAGLRKEYENYLRLSVQGDGKAAAPGTPILDTRPVAPPPAKPALIQVPSDFKPVAEKGSPAEPYARALSDFIDASRSKPANYGMAVGSNGAAIQGFLDYVDKNREAIDASYAPATFKPGFNGASDAYDIENAFKNNASLRKEYETYLRLSVQGGGEAAPPGTPILDPRGAARPDHAPLPDGPKAPGIGLPHHPHPPQHKPPMGHGPQSPLQLLNTLLHRFGIHEPPKSPTQADQLLHGLVRRMDGLNEAQHQDVLHLQGLLGRRNEAADALAKTLEGLHG